MDKDINIINITFLKIFYHFCHILSTKVCILRLLLVFVWFEKIEYVWLDLLLDVGIGCSSHAAAHPASETEMDDDDDTVDLEKDDDEAKDNDEAYLR